MLTFEQIKAIENALGADKAGPVIQAFESVEERVRIGLATRDQLDAKASELKAYMDIRLAETKSELVKWVAGMLVAQAALIAALVKLL